VLWLLAVQITPHTARHPAFCHTSSRRRHELQPTILVSALTYPPMPTTSRPTYQAKPIAHTPCSGLVQNIFSLPARLIYVSGSACAYCRHAAKLKMLCIEGGRPAADGGPMQIECREGLALRCAETVRRSTTDQTARRETVFFEKISQSEPLRKPKAQICSAMRRTTTDRGEARRILLMERVVSCGSGDQPWGTKLDFSSRKPFDDSHRSTAFGAARERTCVIGGGGLLCGWWFRAQ
jgi:hypothetical protein